jgi:hypothetical protein
MKVVIGYRTKVHLEEAMKHLEVLVRRLHLPQLDPKASNLHLMIIAA